MGWNIVKRLLSNVILVFLLIILIVGCTNEKNKNEYIVTARDYYPFDNNLKKTYEGVGNEFANQTTFIEYTEENKAQIKVLSPGTVIVKVVEYENGEIREIYREEEFYHIENKLNSHNQVDNVLLKEPIEIGTSWSTPDGYKRTITGIDVDIETPYKTFKAVEVTTQYEENRKQMDYYVKDIGHVASIYIDNDIEVKTLLKDLSKDPYKLSMRFYYPTSDMKVVYVDREVDFNTNDKIDDIFEGHMKNPGYEELLPVIAEDVSINSLELDKTDGLIRVDFSKELLSNMDNEILVLKSIVNTFGSYYNVENVYISVEGKPYDSDIFSLKEDEFFSVDYTNVEEYNKN